MIKENNFSSSYAKARAAIYTKNKKKGEDVAKDAINDYNAETNAIADINAERKNMKPERIYATTDEEPWEREDRLENDDRRSDFNYLHPSDFKYNPDDFIGDTDDFAYFEPYVDESKTIKKNVVKLTESQLYQVIGESVKKLIREYDADIDGKCDWNQWDDEMDAIDGRDDEYTDRLSRRKKSKKRRYDGIEEPF